MLRAASLCRRGKVRKMLTTWIGTLLRFGALKLSLVVCVRSDKENSSTGVAQLAIGRAVGCFACSTFRFRGSAVINHVVDDGDQGTRPVRANRFHRFWLGFACTHTPYIGMVLSHFCFLLAFS